MQRPVKNMVKQFVDLISPCLQCHDLILEPLKETHLEEDELKELKKHYDHIRNLLDKMR